MITFTIPGEPVTQGSMAAVLRRGKPVAIHSKRRSRIGRDRESIESWPRACEVSRAERDARIPPIDGPVEVVATFALPRVKQPRCAYPDTKPDLDKLCRALGDALEGVVVLQDSRIVRWSAAKVWTDEEPGVRVSVREVGVSRGTATIEEGAWVT